MKPITQQINELIDVLRGNKTAGGLPAKDYPPANIASMIKECKNAGRDDLGQEIMDAWNRVLDKYPQARLNWPAAVKIGTASIKKNVFGHRDFAEWFSEQDGAPARQQIKEPPAPKIKAPALAIPKDDETPEDWQAEANKTKKMLDQGDEAFENAEQFVAYLEKETGDLQRKIETYGPGGPKSGGKLSERVPKWQAQLKVYEEKLKETKTKLEGAKSKFKKAKAAYNEAPLTTVAYEKKAQEPLEDILGFILEMKDLEKQKEMLAKFNDTLKKMDKAPKAASFRHEAGFWDSIMGALESFFDWVKDAWEGLVAWAKKLFGAVDKFDEIANIRY